jgi:hypothetical protein
MGVIIFSCERWTRVIDTVVELVSIFSTINVSSNFFIDVLVTDFTRVTLTPNLSLFIYEKI